MKRLFLLLLFLLASTVPEADAIAGEGEFRAAGGAEKRQEAWNRQIVSDAFASFATGPDADAPWGDRARAALQTIARRLADASLMSVPNHREWGRYYDLALRDGADDPVLRWGSVVAQHKWNWDEKARRQLSDLENRVAGADATLFQKMLAAQARNLLDPSDRNAATFRAAADAWRKNLPASLPAAEIDKTLAMLGYAPAPPAGNGETAVAEPQAEPGEGNDRGTAADSDPRTHRFFVSSVYLPVLEREILAPLEERDGDAPWRADALAAVRDWLARSAREEPRLDPSFLARAASAAGRGCGWPSVRYLAAVARWNGAGGGKAHLEAARRAMQEAVRDALRDPATPGMERFLLLRDFCPRATAGDGAWERELADSFATLAAGRPWTGTEARVLWWLGRRAFEDATADSVAELVWGDAGDGRGGAATNRWLREMAAGAAELRRAWAARGEGPEESLPDGARAAWERHRRAAADAFGRAAALEPAFPEAPLCLVACWLGRPAEARRWLDETLRREPDCPDARSAYLWGLRPRWGGSVEAMLAFGGECLAAADAAPPGAAVRDALAWAEARFAAASELGDRWEEAFRGDGVVEAADRAAAAIAAAPGAGIPETRDALWMPICPLWANNRFDGLARACDAFGKALGNSCPLAVDFDSSHPMRRHKFGLFFGVEGYHRETVAEALRLWRVEGDPAGARALLEPLVGRIEYGSGLDDWEQSFLCGTLARLCAEISPRTGEPYTLLPRSGTSGRAKFWASWNGSVRADAGAWSAPGPGAGELRSGADVLPADCALSFAVRPLEDGKPCRLYVLPDVGDWDLAARPALLLERDPDAGGGWTLGWAVLRHVDDAETFGKDEIADRFGPRAALVPDPDGAVRFELRIFGGSAGVSAAGEDLPALTLSGRFLATPHRLGFAGLGFRLVEAAARAEVPPPHESASLTKK